MGRDRGDAAPGRVPPSRKVEALVAPTMPRKPPVEAVKPPSVAAVGGGGGPQSV